MSDLQVLAEMESAEQELVPTIVPDGKRLAVRGEVAKFVDLFSRGSSVTPLRETIPGTAYALLEATPEGITLTATDGEHTVRSSLTAVTVTASGAVLLPPKRVLDILRLAPGATVRLEVIGSALMLRSGRALWSVQIPVGEALDTALTPERVTMHPVPAGALLRGLAVAYRAVARSAARPSLMQAQVRNGAITASSGAQIHRQTIAGMPADLTFTIPLKAMEEVMRALRALDPEEMVQVGPGERQVAFRYGSDSLLSRRLLLPFPEQEDLLRKPLFENQHRLTISRSALLDAIRHVRINADQDFATVTLTLTPIRQDKMGDTAWALVVSTRDRIGNASKEALTCQFSGPAKPRSMTFNHRFLTDLLESYDGEEAVLRLADDARTVKTPLLLEDPTTGFVALVQQMRGL